MHVSCVAVQPLQSGLLLLAQYRSLQEPEPGASGHRTPERKIRGGTFHEGFLPRVVFDATLLRFSPTTAAAPYRPTQWPLSGGEQVAEAQAVGQLH